jgi:hypothetical protein
MNQENTKVRFMQNITKVGGIHEFPLLKIVRKSYKEESNLIAKKG